MQKFFVLVAFLGLLALPLLAQDNPKLGVFAGYQYEHLGNFPSSGTDFNTNGWDAALNYFFSRHLGVTGDFSGVYTSVNGDTYSLYTYSGGPVFAFREGRFNPFAHVLFGGASLCGCFSGSGSSTTINGFTLMMGGGVDAKFSQHFAIRLGQFDWVYYDFSHNGASKSFSDNVRFSTGVVARF